MKNELLKLLIIHLSGEVAKHKANLTVYFDNPAGIGEHPDIIEAMRGELSKLAAAEEELDTLSKHFSK
ncbi:MAG: hypothetical protein CM15mV38_0540 [uncultured marine virus]|jgi:hypothetical protein|nr:MAG: hypothetical protein CM15mV38_0540 [uncultured marine virus]|tara:strand:- start:776 stop:979 length:204 start_codon:yes stop_codon:yes gene_type:complete